MPVEFRHTVHYDNGKLVAMIMHILHGSADQYRPILVDSGGELAKIGQYKLHKSLMDIIRLYLDIETCSRTVN